MDQSTGVSNKNNALYLFYNHSIVQKNLIASALDIIHGMFVTESFVGCQTDVYTINICLKTVSNKSARARVKVSKKRVYIFCEAPHALVLINSMLLEIIYDSLHIILDFHGHAYTLFFFSNFMQKKKYFRLLKSNRFNLELNQ